MKDRDPVTKYLEPGPDDYLWGITVTTVGYQSIRPGDFYPPRQNHPDIYLFSPERGRILDEYQLLYIARGSGRFTAKSTGLMNEIRLGEGDAFLLFPGEWHSYRPDSGTGWDEYWIGFRGRVIDDRIRNGFFDRMRPVLHPGINDEMVGLFHQALLHANRQGAGFQQVLAGYVNMLLGLSYSLDRDRGERSLQTEESIDKAKLIIRQNYRDIRPQALARMLNMSYSSFRKVFKEQTGTAPARYIGTVKLEKSKELLTQTILSIKEIAYHMGFENPEYFFTAFKKKNGLTPLEYRRRHSRRTVGG